MLHKIYGQPVGKEQERRYSPAVCTGIDVKVMAGNPDMSLASTSYVERQNLTMRMGMRRFTRLTNGSPRRSRTWPTDHVWTRTEIAALLD